MLLKTWKTPKRCWRTLRKSNYISTHPQPPHQFIIFNVMLFCFMRNRLFSATFKLSWSSQKQLMYSTAKTFDTSEMMLKNIGYLSCPQLKKKKWRCWNQNICIKVNHIMMIQLTSCLMTIFKEKEENLTQPINSYAE